MGETPAHGACPAIRQSLDLHRLQAPRTGRLDALGPRWTASLKGTPSPQGGEAQGWGPAGKGGPARGTDVPHAMAEQPSLPYQQAAASRSTGAGQFCECDVHGHPTLSQLHWVLPSICPGSGSPGRSAAVKWTASPRVTSVGQQVTQLHFLGAPEGTTGGFQQSGCGEAGRVRAPAPAGEGAREGQRQRTEWQVTSPALPRRGDSSRRTRNSSSGRHTPPNADLHICDRNCLLAPFSSR